MQNTLTTLIDYARWGASRFNEANLYFGHGRDNSIDEAIDLVLHATHLPRELPDVYWQCQLTEPEKKRISDLFEQRINQRMPNAYLTNQAYFAGLEFYVDQRVLIPRSPIAELIENGFHPWLSTAPENILDLCCGSACIGIASAHAFPNASVVCSDISTEALAVAEKNINAHQMQEQVQWLQSDGLNDIKQRFDLIVCNPPYVDAKAMARLPAEYRHEPQLGLASGDDGLDFVRSMLASLPKFLIKGGLLVLEVGASREAFLQQFSNYPWTEVELERGGEGVFVFKRSSSTIED